MKYTLILLFACLLYSGVGAQTSLLGDLSGPHTWLGRVPSDQPILRLSPAGFAYGSISTGRKCGTWEAQPQEITEWATVDTLGKKEKPLNEFRDWKYSEESAEYNGWTETIYQPCGSGEPTIYNQFRVCSLTGIRQKRQRIIRYKYIDAPRTDYEKVTDSLYATTAPKLDTMSWGGGPFHLSDTASVISGRIPTFRGDSLSWANPSVPKPKKRKK